MSRRGQRGVASCTKKYRDGDFHVDFDENNLPVGDNHARFMSWLGLKVRKKFSYHIDTKNFDKKMWEQLWLETKEKWNIENDNPKAVVLKKAKKLCTNFRSKLVTRYINKNENPFEKYWYLDSTKWNEFVAAKTKDEFLSKSEKAKSSARANQDPPRLGRSGFTGLKPKLDTIWPQLVAAYPKIEEIQDERSRLWVISRAKKNPQTGLYEIEIDMHEKLNELARLEREMKEDGTYYRSQGDPLTRLLGPEHGGRSRTVSDVIGSTKVHGGLYRDGRTRQQNLNDVSTTKSGRVDTSPTVRGSRCAPGGSYTDYADIETISRCELLYPFKSTCVITVAKGQAYPTSNNILHGSPINTGCVKVLVDTVEQGYEKVPVPDETLHDEVNCIGDILGQFIQWPRKYIKLVNTSRESISASRQTLDLYKPQEKIQHEFAEMQNKTSDKPVDEVERLRCAFGERRGHTSGDGAKPKNVSHDATTSTCISTSQYDNLKEQNALMHQQIEETNERWQQQQELNARMQRQIDQLLAAVGNKRPRLSSDESD